jgi:hypothetical protein
MKKFPLFFSKLIIIMILIVSFFSFVSLIPKVKADINTIVNGGFETGDTLNWNMNETMGFPDYRTKGTNYYQVTNGYHNSGTYSLLVHIWSNIYNMSFSQSFPALSVSSITTFNFYAMINTGFSQMHIRVVAYYNDGSYSTQIFFVGLDGGNIWTHFIFTNLTNNKYLNKIVFQDTQESLVSTICFDDIIVDYAIPFTILNGEYYFPYPTLFSGGGTTNPTSGTYYNYTLNSNIVVQAYPTNSSFQFVYWKMNVSGSMIFNNSNPFTFNFTSGVSIEPFFILENTTLIINSAIGGTTNPINGTYTNYTFNSNVTIFETPNTGYHFGYWLINGYSQNSTNSTSGMITFNITQNTVVQPIFNYNFGFSYTINPTPEIWNQNLYNSSLNGYDYPVFRLTGVYDDLWLRQGNNQYYTLTGTISGIFNLTGTFDVMSGDLMAQDSLIPPVIVGNLYFPNSGFMSRIYEQPFSGINSTFASFSFLFSPRNTVKDSYEDIIIDFFSSNGTIGTGYNYLYLHITWKWIAPMPTSEAIVNSDTFIIAVFLLGIPFAVCVIFLWKRLKFYSIAIGACADFGIGWFSNGLIPLWVLLIIGGLIAFFVYMKISNKTGGRL